MKIQIGYGRKYQMQVKGIYIFRVKSLIGLGTAPWESYTVWNSNSGCLEFKLLREAGSMGDRRTFHMPCIPEELLFSDREPGEMIKTTVLKLRDLKFNPS